MAINWGAAVAFGPVAGIGNTWTDVTGAIDVNALGPGQFQFEVDNESGSVTDAVEIRFLASVEDVADFDDAGIGSFSYQPATVSPEKPGSYVVPGVYHRIKAQARSAGPTDNYTVSGTYRLIDPDA